MAKYKVRVTFMAEPEMKDWLEDYVNRHKWEEQSTRGPSVSDYIRSLVKREMEKDQSATQTE